MDRIIPLLLLVLGLGAAYLGLRGFFSLRRGENREFWLFGLGVRSRLGAIKVLIVSVALCALALAIYKRGTFKKILDVSPTFNDEEVAQQTRILEEANRRIESFQAQITALVHEKEACQEIVSKQGLGLANNSDIAAEMRASLNLRQREISDLKVVLNRTQTELENLKREQSQLLQASEQSKERIGELESQIDVLKNEKVTLTGKIENAKSSEIEQKRLLDENAKLKSFSKDQDRRANLLRQGLVLRESNDWALEQELQRLASLVSDQPEVSNPRQTDIARSLQKISQVLREGQALTKQAKLADSKTATVSPDNPSKPPDRKKSGP